MAHFKTLGIVLLTILLLVAVIFGAVQYGRSSKSSPVCPVSMIELSRSSDEVGPKWIAIADPNKGTVSIVEVSKYTIETSGTVTSEASASIIAMTPYSEITK